MKILVTGTEGYIGARLAPWLEAAGHEVTGLDIGLYRDGCLYLDPRGIPFGPRTVYKDLRTVTNATVSFEKIFRWHPRPNEEILLARWLAKPNGAVAQTSAGA